MTVVREKVTNIGLYSSGDRLRLTGRELQVQPNPARILVIGSGLSGMLTAMRLLQSLTQPTEIALLERADNQRQGGIAYSEATTNWEHILNLPADRISAFPETPDDFMTWANCEADRSDWPPTWQDTTFGKNSAFPRRMYLQYLTDRLDQAVQNAVPGVSLIRLGGEAIKIAEEQNGSLVTYVNRADPTALPKTYNADQIILATGHGEKKTPAFATDVIYHPNFIANQHSADGREAIDRIGRDKTVFIVGTGLSAFDAVISLLHNGHKGRIILSSHHGYTYFTYPTDYEHEILTLRRPAFLDTPTLTLDYVIAEGVREYFAQVEWLQRERPDLNPVVYPERILKAWEPYIAELVQRLSPEDVQQLLSIFGPLAITSRAGTLPLIGDRIAKAMQEHEHFPPQVSIIKADILSMAPSEDEDRISIVLNQGGNADLTSITVDVVINSTGLEADYSRISSPIWRDLIDERRIAMPHGKTRRGVEVGEHGELINPSGELARGIFVVGPPRQGDELEKRGRVGPPVFGIGTIRNQAVGTVFEALDQLEESHGRSQGLPHLHLSVASSNIDLILMQEATREMGQGVTDAVRQKILHVVQIALSEILIDEQIEIFLGKNTMQKRNFDAKIALIELALAGELIRAGVSYTMATNIIQEAAKQRERIIVRRFAS